jgi:DNA polymerase III delta prime subunit
MGILNIRPVKKGGSKPIIAIAGPSGSGKTYTALKMARGMVKKPSEIGFLDTESGRGSLYYDILDGPFQIADLYAPFSPARYSQAIKEFIANGVKVLVIDSGSHEWEGEGGCDDIANAPKADGSPRKVANWVGAKRMHKGFMNTILYSDIPIIICLRAREKTDFKIIDKPVSLGIQPICEKNFMFEMTASILMADEGKKQTFLKVPAFLKPYFGNGTGYLGEETGKKVLAWFSNGDNEDPEVTRLKSEMLMACEFGLAGVIAIWNTLSAPMKKKLEAHKNVCKEAAEEYERQAAQAEETPADELSRVQKESGTAKIDLP